MHIQIIHEIFVQKYFLCIFIDHVDFTAESQKGVKSLWNNNQLKPFSLSGGILWMYVRTTLEG